MLVQNMKYDDMVILKVLFSIVFYILKIFDSIVQGGTY